MKNVLLPATTTILACMTLTATSVQAQSKPYEDLLVKYVDEKYEDCIVKAERYTMADDTKKDALPYLYMSMCLFEMSKIPKYQEMEDYKNADREAY